MTSTISVGQSLVIGGIDAHADTHHVVALDDHGRYLGDRQFPATGHGYRQALDFLASFGLIAMIGCESTGSYAAGITRYLLACGIEVIEVNQPHPHTRSRQGKNDAIDAEMAARTALSGQGRGVPKDTTGVVESIRILLIARDSAVRSRTRALVQLRDILTTAPEQIRHHLATLNQAALIHACRALRPDTNRLNEPSQATKQALRALAARITTLDSEIRQADHDLDSLVATHAPTLISKYGVGTITAAQLLVTAGQNIDRLHSEAAFARLCGVAPIPVSSGKSNRMRLHRGGDRQANRALHMIAVVRLRYHQPTIDYMQRRQTEGLSKKDVLRCLKRYIARETYHALKTDLQPT